MFDKHACAAGIQSCARWRSTHRIPEGEHEEDEEASASEEGESEGTHESVGADGGEELPVSQASQEDDDDDSDKVEDDEASATEEEDWRRTTRGASDTVPTGKLNRSRRLG